MDKKIVTLREDEYEMIIQGLKHWERYLQREIAVNDDEWTRQDLVVLCDAFDALRAGEWVTTNNEGNR